MSLHTVLYTLLTFAAVNTPSRRDVKGKSWTRKGLLKRTQKVSQREREREREKNLPLQQFLLCTKSRSSSVV